jgi:hypothetical protein
VIVELQAVIDRDGATATGSRGQVRVHPAVGEMRALTLAQKTLLTAIELEDPALRIVEQRARTAARTVEWRRRRSLGAAS